jgi:hypothetical protein
MKSFISALFLLCVFDAVLAQSPSLQSPVLNYAPEELAKQIKTLQNEIEDCSCECDRKPCKTSEDKRLTQLKLLTKNIAKELQISEGSSIEDCSDVATASVRLHGLHDAGFVRMQCGWDLNLIFTVKQDQVWRFLQTIVVPNKYKNARVSVLSVTGEESQQVIVHKAQYQSGTGINQQNLVVFDLKDERLSPILDVVETAWLTSPWTEHEISQESKFVFTGRSKDTQPCFEETQRLHFSGLTVELKREHTWDKDKHAFVATQWYSGLRLNRGAIGKESPQHAKIN